MATEGWELPIRREGYKATFDRPQSKWAENMKPSQLCPGDLIRHAVTNNRWHLGVVREVDGDSVELEYFWGAVESVPLESVTLFRDYLDSRERVLSLERTALCEAFFGEPLNRLREERFRKIESVLRQHGIDFEPKHWAKPETRIQFWRDASVVLSNKTDKDTKFAALLPRWLEPLKLPPSSRDPLGFQAHAERLANELLPGVTVFTSRIGYYGLLTWAVQFLNQRPSPSGASRLERLQRLERALALCEFTHHGAEDNSCPLLGQRSRTQILQSAQADRFKVPQRILKNQTSAGAYRLYYTSMQSMGFTEEATELAAEELLPLKLTDLGRKLAHGFDQRLPGEFAEFGLSDGSRDRDTIRSWGRRLCFSEIGRRGRYREPFLEGFLLGNSPDAEKRFWTVERLFQRGLLPESYGDEPETVADDMLSEDDARAGDEVAAVAGLTNGTVLLLFYDEPPQDDNRDFQCAAVFELLSLGLSALFQIVVEELWKEGRTRPSDLVARLAGHPQYGQFWAMPVTATAARLPTARKLAQRLLEADDPFDRATIGGVLLIRVLRDRPLAATADDLASNPAFILAHEALRSQPERCLTEAYLDLVKAMVERHLAVSLNKNRQRWCYFDGDILRKDDLQAMRVGFHSFRFPQLLSLCRDLGLKKEELRHGG